jgi:hypothetical protein
MAKIVEMIAFFCVALVLNALADKLQPEDINTAVRKGIRAPGNRRCRQQGWQAVSGLTLLFAWQKSKTANKNHTASRKMALLWMKGFNP